MSILNGTVTVTIISFSPKNSNGLDRTSDLKVPGDWQNTAKIVAAMATTNYTKAVLPISAFFRIRVGSP